MVFKVREAIGGIRHLTFRYERIAARRPAWFYVSRFSDCGLSAEPFLDFEGKPALCEVCGYSIIRISTSNKWRIEICSAMPPIPPINGSEFNQWLQTLSGELPTTCL